VARRVNWPLQWARRVILALLAVGSAPLPLPPWTQRVGLVLVAAGSEPPLKVRILPPTDFIALYVLDFFPTRTYCF